MPLVRHVKGWALDVDRTLVEALAPFGLVLCGGYCRDMLLGRTPRDMDFIPVLGDLTPVEWLDQVYRKVQDALWGLYAISVKEHVAYADHCCCIASWRIRGEAGTVREFQIVFARNPTTTAEDCVQEFNWSFNQCLYSPTLDQHYVLPAARTAWAEGTPQWTCSTEAPKLAAKYEDRLGRLFNFKTPGFPWGARLKV